MARFWRIQIESFYLTSTGMAGGLPCKLTVRGADALLNPFRQSVHQSLNFTPYIQKFDAGTKGRNLDIEIQTHIKKALWESLIDLRNEAIGNGETLTIIGTGDIGNFNIEALPLEFTAEDFRTDRIFKPVFRFITT